MRVVAGRWGGRRLRAPRGRAVRPTTDRVKEALFSILGAEVAGARVADLCCGAGGLGIEALSRGAAHAVFVDRDRRSLEAVRENLTACGAEPACYSVVAGDAVAWLSAATPAEGPWFVLADPPYGSGLATRLADVLAGRGDEGCFLAVVVEHAADEVPAADGWLGDSRRYGESYLTILRPEAGADPEVVP